MWQGVVRDVASRLATGATAQKAPTPMYPVSPAAVHCAQQRLQLVAALVDRDDDTSAHDVARAFGVSVPQTYKLATQARLALLPRSPGPRPTSTPPRFTASLDALVPTPRAAWDRRGAILEAAVSNVSVRGQRRLFVAFGQSAPSGDFLVDTLARAGRFARSLMARANAQVRDRVVVAAGDDIFFHRVAVKVLVEPVSGALLDVARWPWREAEDWALWIGQWPALRLFVSDLCTDLVGAVPLVNAAREAPVAHQGDDFHECAWWTEKVFEPLSRREQLRAQAALEVWEGATRVKGPGRRVSAATVEAAEARRAQAEEDFYEAVRLEQLFQKLLEPLSPEGARWTDARVEDLLTEFEREALGLPSKYAARIRKHVRRHRTRWCAHRILWDLIPVALRAETSATGPQVLDAVVALRWACLREQQATTWPHAREAQVEQDALRRWLEASCANLEEVTAAVSSLIEHPRRSSSLVEALNSRLRVLQMVHRNVSDNLLALVALAWNLSPRREGKRRGPSPYARLGIDFADDTRPWHQILLEQMDAN